MISVAVLLIAAVVSAAHALLLWRVVRRLHPGGGRVRLVLGALGLRVLVAAALLPAVWIGGLRAALVSLAGLWLGRNAILVAVRAGKG